MQKTSQDRVFRSRNPGLLIRLVRLLTLVTPLAAVASPPAQPIVQPPGQQEVGTPQLVLETRTDARGKISEGHLRVFENRRLAAGRTLDLDVVVLHATAATPRPDPVFFLVGGPGQGAATIWQGMQRSWMREDRDIVLMNQRGTGGSNRLRLPSQTAADWQGYLEPMIRTDQIGEAIRQLGEQADLRMYSTPDAMDDLNDLRVALGYDKINLVGGSYGTRAALVYIRRHEASVRTAILNGVAPIEFTNPLFHARSAQDALEKIFERVENDETYRRAFPDLRGKFDEIMQRFDEGPIPVEVTIRGSDEAVTLQLSREAFASSLRFQMYYLDTSRRVPLVLLQAWNGDFRPFVSSAISRNRALSRSIALGMLLSVTAAEDVARIDPRDIPRVTDNTFLGDGRVRRQIENCRNWPKSELPENFGEPVRSRVPALLLSGEIDPVTPPRWGQICADNFPNSLHLVVPAAHGVGGACIDGIQKAFLDAGTTRGLDTSCVEAMKLPPLELPRQSP